MTPKEAELLTDLLAKLAAIPDTALDQEIARHFSAESVSEVRQLVISGRDAQAAQFLEESTRLPNAAAPDIDFGEWKLGAVLATTDISDVRFATKHGRTGVLKYTPQELAPDIRAVGDAAIRREIGLLQQIESRQDFATYLDGGDQNGSIPFLVTAYIDGGTITEFATRHHLPLSVRLKFFLQAASAISYLHTVPRFVHRDLKPTHLLVDTSHDTPSVRVIDLAFAVPAHAARQGMEPRQDMEFRSPNWSARELFKRDPVTTKTDIYSLAVILYELVTGKLPYTLESSTARGALKELDNWAYVSIHEARVAAGSAAPRNDLASLSALDDILRRALRKAPATPEYEKVDQLIHEVQRATRPTGSVPLIDWRHISVAILMIVLVVLMYTSRRSTSGQGPLVVQPPRQDDRYDEGRLFREWIKLASRQDPAQPDSDFEARKNRLRVEFHAIELRVEAEIASDSTRRVQASIELGRAYYAAGLTVEGHARLHDAVEMASKIDDVEGKVEAICCQAAVNQTDGEANQADSLLEEALGLARQLRDGSYMRGVSVQAVAMAYVARQKPKDLILLATEARGQFSQWSKAVLKSPAASNEIDLRLAQCDALEAVGIAQDKGRDASAEDVQHVKNNFSSAASRLQRLNSTDEYIVTINNWMESLRLMGQNEEAKNQISSIYETQKIARTQGTGANDESFAALAHTYALVCGDKVRRIELLDEAASLRLKTNGKFNMEYASSAFQASFRRADLYGVTPELHEACLRTLGVIAQYRDAGSAELFDCSGIVMKQSQKLGFDDEYQQRLNAMRLTVTRYPALKELWDRKYNPDRPTTRPENTPATSTSPAAVLG